MQRCLKNAERITQVLFFQNVCQPSKQLKNSVSQTTLSEPNLLNKGVQRGLLHYLESNS